MCRRLYQLIIITVHLPSTKYQVVLARTNPIQCRRLASAAPLLSIPVNGSQAGQPGARRQQTVRAAPTPTRRSGSAWPQASAAGGSRREGASESHTGSSRDEELIIWAFFTFELDAVVQQLGRTKGRQTQLGWLPFLEDCRSFLCVILLLDLCFFLKNITNKYGKYLLNPSQIIRRLTFFDT